MTLFWDFFWSVMALVLVLEGLLPALCPTCWRNMMRTLCKYSDTTLRRIGLAIMIVGAFILVLIHHIM